MMTTDLSTSEAITQAHAEATAIQAEVWAATREVWEAVDASPGGIGVTHPAAVRLLAAQAASDDHDWRTLAVSALDALTTTRQALAELMRAVTPALQRSDPKSEWANAWETAQALIDGREPRGLIPQETPNVP